MHDPMTVAFQINSPFRSKMRMKDGTLKRSEYRNTWFTIWHVDPCKGPGGDDSCGWYMRAHHGDPKVLAKIERDFEVDWDRIWKSDSGHVYNCGFFLPVPNGTPHLSVHGITINLFFIAAIQVLGSREKAVKWMNKNLFEILLFSENPVDSLYDGFTRKFSIGCNEPYTERQRKERIHATAACIYAWILRDIRPWYKHPRWHVRHWKIQWHYGQRIYRFLMQRCHVCGKRIWPKQSVVSLDWNGSRLVHEKCHGSCMAAQQPSEVHDTHTKTATSN